MNKRLLTCGKTEVLAIGAEGSISDLKEKLTKKCFLCSNFIACKGASGYLKELTRQQENLVELINKTI